MSKKEKLQGKDLAALGYENNELRSLAMLIVGRLYKHDGKEKQIEVLKDLMLKPEDYLMHPELSPIVNKILEIEKDTPKYIFEELDVLIIESPKILLNIPIVIKFY